MSKIDDYRKNAGEMMRLAQRALTTDDKRRLMRVAEGWLNLADRILEGARCEARTGVRSPPRESDQRADDPR